MARILCTVLEAPVMVDTSAGSGQIFQDLVPWGDPYIVSLIRKLQSSSGATVDETWPRPKAYDEAPPPLVEPAVETFLPPRNPSGGWSSDRFGYGRG